MAVIATASVSYSVRIFIMVLLCVGFSLWFAYDGWINWPTRNDEAIRLVINDPKGVQAEEDNMKTFKAWPGYARASSDQIQEMDALTKRTLISEWKTSYDLMFQRVLAVGVGILSLGLIRKFLRYRALRAIADDNSLSPQKGVVIPWKDITKVDNTRWKKSGIVTLTYVDPTGAQRTAKLDEYDLDNLIPVLQEVEKHAINAEFIPPPEPAAA